MTEYTKGPWVADTSRQYSSHARVEGSEKLICSVGNGERCDVAFDEWSANARLIAAAPDLLAALTELLADIDAGGEYSTSARYAADQAILKATA